MFKLLFGLAIVFGFITLDYVEANHQHFCYSQLSSDPILSQGKIEIDPLSFVDQHIYLSRSSLSLAASGNRWKNDLFAIDYQGTPCVFSSDFDMIDFLREIPKINETVSVDCESDMGHLSWPAIFYVNIAPVIIPWYNRYSTMMNILYEDNIAPPNDQWFVIEPLSETRCFVRGTENLKEFLSPFPYFQYKGLPLNPQQQEILNLS